MIADFDYRCWLASDRGLVRSNNEDACAVSSSSETPAAWEGIIPAERGWALIADGMGGHAAGEVASRLAVECLRTISALLDDEEGIRQAVAAVHDIMFSAMRENPGLAGMGTTVAGVVLRGNDVLAFNVGDSRIYHHMGPGLSLVSEDHVIHGHILTQCLGGTSPSEIPEPFVTRIMVETGERLLLCSDGLTDMVSDADIEAILRLDQAAPAQALVSAALEAGGADNVSVIVLERLA